MNSKLIFTLILFLLSLNAHSQLPFAVYRGDHRQDINEIQDFSIQENANSTLSVFSKENLKYKNGFFQLDRTTMEKALKLCSNEKFAQQISAADCTAILVDHNKILTAGHCVSKKTCGSTAFGFGYKIQDSGEEPHQLPQEEMYSCKKIISRSNTDTLDFAIIELDRSVENHRPVRIAKERIDLNEKVYMIGNSGGSPLKYSPPNIVLSSTKYNFTSEIDALGGNSGAGVFRADTNELVGILVSGEEDYVYDKKAQCNRINHCENNKCIGEESTHLEPILREVLK